MIRTKVIIWHIKSWHLKNVQQRGVTITVPIYNCKSLELKVLMNNNLTYHKINFLYFFTSLYP